MHYKLQYIIIMVNLYATETWEITATSTLIKFTQMTRRNRIPAIYIRIEIIHVGLGTRVISYPPRKSYLHKSMHTCRNMLSTEKTTSTQIYAHVSCAI